MPPKANVRKLAATALGRWRSGHVYADSLVGELAQKHGLSSADRGLLNAIVLGSLRNLSLLDHFISVLRPGGRLDDSMRDLLRVGLCQLLILELPEHASVNETVNAAPRHLKGLANGVLRSALRRKDELLAGVQKLPLATRYSHPEQLVSRWEKLFGREETIALLEWNQKPANTFVRINKLKPGRHKEVRDSGLGELFAPDNRFLEVKGPVPPLWFKDGLVYGQDPATRHSVELLSPQPGEVILDACAAPGGKAALAADAMANQGRLICTDSNDKRLPRLEGNLETLGVKIAEVLQHDWTEACPEALRGRCDGVLLDVPCSNTGVLRRRVDARWRHSGNTRDELISIQRNILKNALQAINRTGRIVYSTCSIDPSENGDLVRSVIADTTDFLISKEIQVLPQVDQTDGAYAALIERA